jgi:hypothetical protein
MCSKALSVTIIIFARAPFFFKKFLGGSAGKIISFNPGIMMLPDNVFSSGKQDKMAEEKA